MPTNVYLLGPCRFCRSALSPRRSRCSAGRVYRFSMCFPRRCSRGPGVGVDAGAGASVGQRRERPRQPRRAERRSTSFLFW